MPTLEANTKANILPQRQMDLSSLASERHGSIRKYRQDYLTWHPVSELVGRQADKLRAVTYLPESSCALWSPRDTWAVSHLHSRRRLIK